MYPTVRSILDKVKAPALLISNPVNVRYLTGVSVSFGFALLSGKKCTLFTDSRYLEMCQKSVRKGVSVRLYSNLSSVLQKLKSCGFEADTVTVSKLRNWKRTFKNTKFVQTSGVIEEFRRSKKPEEIRAFQKAQSITRAMMKRVPKVLQKGTTEREIAWKLQEWARSLGADGVSFDPIVAFGTHTSRPHHSPTDRKLKKGDIVQIDVGARFKGYCADQSDVFFTGSPTKKQQTVYDALKEAKAAAIKTIKSGATNHKADAVARDILKKFKLEQFFMHALGHGVGLEIHEGVTLSSKAPKMTLLRNEIVTVEPGVYIEGKFGMRLEEEIIVR